MSHWAPLEIARYFDGKDIDLLYRQAAVYLRAYNAAGGLLRDYMHACPCNKELTNCERCKQTLALIGKP